MSSTAEDQDADENRGCNRPQEAARPRKKNLCDFLQQWYDLVCKTIASHLKTNAL